MPPQPGGYPLVGVGGSSAALSADSNLLAPPEPWINPGLKAVAVFKYPTRCIPQKYPGHPHQGPLHIVLHTQEALPSGKGLALWTSVREHFGGDTTLHPHEAPTGAPIALAPWP